MIALAEKGGCRSLLRWTRSREGGREGRRGEPGGNRQGGRHGGMGAAGAMARREGGRGK